MPAQVEYVMHVVSLDGENDLRTRRNSLARLFRQWLRADLREERA